MSNYTVLPQKRLSVLVGILLCFTACNHSVQQEDLFGTWELYHYGDAVLAVDILDLLPDQAIIDDMYASYRSVGWEFVGDQIILRDTLWQEPLILEIDKRIQDTLWLKDGTRLQRTIQDSPTTTIYLPNILGGSPLPERERKVAQVILHYSPDRDENRAPVLRMGRQPVSKKDIPLVLSVHHVERVDLILFVDRRIKLAALKELYGDLTAAGNQRIYIVTRQTGWERYECLRDRYSGWQDEIAAEHPRRPPSLPAPYPSRVAFLAEPGHQEVPVLGLSDSTEIVSLPHEQIYLFSFSSGILLEDYLRLRLFLCRQHERGLLYQIDIS